MRRALTIIGITVIASFVVPAVAQAHLRAVDGVCGVHRGKLVLRNQGHEEFKVRFGVKRGNYGGSHRCRGHYRKRVSGGLTTNGVFDWHPFDLPNWRFGAVADVAAKTGVTIAACGGFVTSIGAELPSGGSSTLVVVGLAGGCYEGLRGLNAARNDYAFLRR